MTTTQANAVEPVEKTYKSFSSVKAENLDKKWEEVKDKPTPDAKEQATLTMLDERLTEAKDAKSKKHDIWNYSYLQYRSVNHYSMLYGGFPTYWNQWGMGVFIPRTFETVESIKVQMQGRKPDFMVSATRPSTKNYSKKVNSLMKSEWKRSKAQTEVAETVHDVLVYGTGIIRTDLKNERKMENTMAWKQETIDKPDGTQETRWTIEYKEQEVQKYYGVGCKRVDPYDFYPNPSAEGYRMDKLGHCFERSVVDAWDLREEYRMLEESGAFGVTDNWKYLKPGGDVSDYKYLRKEIDGLYSFSSDARTPSTINDLVGRTTKSPNNANNKTKIELWEYWEEDRYIVMTGTGLILRDSPNPYPHKQLPYSKYALVEMNEFFSMGLPEYIRWLQICENILYDQGLNNIIMSVHKMFAVNSKYLEDEGELVARPFGIIHLKQMPNVRISDAIMPIEYSHQMGNYFEFMKQNTQNIQSVTGISPYQTGGVNDAAKTERATVANRLAFAGSARIEEISRHMEDDLVTGVVEQMIGIMQFYYQNTSHFEDGELPIEVDEPNKNFFLKYLSKPNGDVTAEEIIAAKAAGYEGIIAQDEIQGRYKVVSTGSSSSRMDPEQLANMKMEFAKFAQTAVVNTTDPMSGLPTSTPVFDFAKIAKEVAEDVFDIEDAEEYLYKPPTAPAPVMPMVPGEMPMDVPVDPADPAVELENPELLEADPAPELVLENPELLQP